MSIINKKIKGFNVKVCEVYGTLELKISKNKRILVEKTYYEMEDLEKELNLMVTVASNKAKNNLLKTRRKSITVNTFKLGMVIKHITSAGETFYKLVKKQDNYFVFDRLEYINSNKFGKVTTPSAHRVIVTDGKIFKQGKIKILDKGE